MVDDRIVIDVTFYNQSLSFPRIHVEYIGNLSKGCMFDFYIARYVPNTFRIRAPGFIFI